MEEKKKSVSGNLVIYTNLVCENTQCGNRKVITKQFEAPGIPYVDYIHESIRITCPGCGIKYKDDPIFGVSPNWKGFDNDNGHDSKSHFNTNSTENRDEDGGDGRDDENGNSQGERKPTKAQLIIPAVKPHLNKLFTDEYGIPHAGIQVDDHIEVLKLNYSIHHSNSTNFSLKKSLDSFNRTCLKLPATNNK